MPRYSEHKILPYAPEDVFDLVADLIIGWKLIRESFTSRVTLTGPTKIHVDYIDGPMRYMNNDWTFTRTPEGHCAIDFIVDFEFKSRTLEAVMGVFFGEAVRRMVGAFEDRAKEKLGSSAR